MLPRFNLLSSSSSRLIQASIRKQNLGASLYSTSTTSTISTQPLLKSHSQNFPKSSVQEGTSALSSENHSFSKNTSEEKVHSYDLKETQQGAPSIDNTSTQLYHQNSSFHHANKETNQIPEQSNDNQQGTLKVGEQLQHTKDTIVGKSSEIMNNSMGQAEELLMKTKSTLGLDSDKPIYDQTKENFNYLKDQSTKVLDNTQKQTKEKTMAMFTQAKDTGGDLIDKVKHEGENILEKAKSVLGIPQNQPLQEKYQDTKKEVKDKAGQVYNQITSEGEKKAQEAQGKYHETKSEFKSMTEDKHQEGKQASEGLVEKAKQYLRMSENKVGEILENAKEGTQSQFEYVKEQGSKGIEAIQNQAHQTFDNLKHKSQETIEQAKQTIGLDPHKTIKNDLTEKMDQGKKEAKQTLDQTKKTAQKKVDQTTNQVNDKYNNVKEMVRNVSNSSIFPTEHQHSNQSLKIKDSSSRNFSFEDNQQKQIYNDEALFGGERSLPSETQHTQNQSNTSKIPESTKDSTIVLENKNFSNDYWKQKPNSKSNSVERGPRI